MTEIGKETNRLIKERAEMCHSGTPCRECEVDKFRKDFAALKLMNCDTIYMVIKLLGYNEYSAEYCMNQYHRLEKICDENNERCLTCNFYKETEGINCLCYIIGRDLLREV